jgi:hypothetical protein
MTIPSINDLSRHHAKRCTQCPGNTHSLHWDGFLNTHSRTLIHSISAQIDLETNNQSTYDKENLMSLGLMPMIQAAARLSLQKKVVDHVNDTIDDFEPIESYVEGGLAFLRVWGLFDSLGTR